jgi:hypothetical protein
VFSLLVVIFFRHNFDLVEVQFVLMTFKLIFNFTLVLLLVVVVLLDLDPFAVPAESRE